MRDYIKLKSWAGRLACWYGVIVNAFKIVNGKEGRDRRRCREEDNIEIANRIVSI
jgi:hypothetical protein